MIGMGKVIQKWSSDQGDRMPGGGGSEERRSLVRRLAQAAAQGARPDV